MVILLFLFSLVFFCLFLFFVFVLGAYIYFYEGYALQVKAIVNEGTTSESNSGWVKTHCIGATNPNQIGPTLDWDPSVDPDQYGIGWDLLVAQAPFQNFNIPLPNFRRAMCGHCRDDDCFVSADISFEGMTASTPCTIRLQTNEYDLKFQQIGLMEVKFFCQPQHLSDIVWTDSIPGGLAFELKNIYAPWISGSVYSVPNGGLLGETDGLVGVYAWPPVTSSFDNSMPDIIEVGKLYDLPQITVTHGIGASYGSRNVLTLNGLDECNSRKYDTMKDGVLSYYFFPSLAETYALFNESLYGKYVLTQNSSCFSEFDILEHPLL
jgi:hypothetical protein